MRANIRLCGGTRKIVTDACKDYKQNEKTATRGMRQRLRRVIFAAAVFGVTFV